MPRISEFCAQYPNSRTRKVYASPIFSFLAYIYNLPREKKITSNHQAKYETLADQYLKDERNYSRDLISYAASFEGKPPKTARCYVSAVREFLIYYDVEISPKESRSLRNKLPKDGAATIERDLDVDTLRSILHHCNLMMSALILMLASSGMRIGEALQLRIEDIDLSGKIGAISIRSETSKNGMQRYTFCSAEAVEAIKEWQKQRDKYLAESLNKGRGLGITKDPNDTRLFPVSDSTVSAAWENAIRAAGFHSRDPRTNRLQIHIHMLRKFFSSQIRLVVPVDIVEGLLGHSGYLSDAYRRYTRKQVEEFYRKGEPYISILMTEEIRDLKTNTETRLSAQGEILESIVRENMQLKHDVSELKNLAEVFQRYLSKTE